MRSLYVLTICLTLCVLQTPRRAIADSANMAADSGMAGVSVPSPTKRKIVAHAVDFGPTTGAIRPEGEPVLDEAVQLIGGDLPVTVIVAPPVDGRSTDTQRRMLARRHAKAVRRYLLVHGITADRIMLRNDATDEIAAVVVPTERLAHSRPVELYVE